MEDSESLSSGDSIKLWLIRFFKVFCGILGILLCTALLLGCAIHFYPRHTLTIESGDVRADVLVVLGGQRDERPKRAAELYKQGAAPRILVSGAGDCEQDVQILEKNGVPPEVIVQEPNSTSTLQNAEFSAPILRGMNAHRVIIVTSWFHSRRAVGCFEHFAPEIRFYSRPSYLTYTATKANQRDVRNYVHTEYVKLMAYWVLHGICPIHWH